MLLGLFPNYSELFSYIEIDWSDEFIDSYDRFEVKPGITGLSQVSGNVNIEWGERFKIDAYYTRNLSFYLDLKIMAASLLVVILGERRFLKIKIWKFA